MRQETRRLNLGVMRRGERATVLNRWSVRVGGDRDCRQDLRERPTATDSRSVSRPALHRRADHPGHQPGAQAPVETLFRVGEV